VHRQFRVSEPKGPHGVGPQTLEVANVREEALKHAANVSLPRLPEKLDVLADGDGDETTR